MQAFSCLDPNLMSCKYVCILCHYSSQKHAVNAIHKYFHVDKNIETTIEINPDDVSDLKLKEFKKLNFNRLSVGVQTFNDEVLKFINRSHDSKTAKDAFSIIEKNGFDNFNLDIIFGLPKSNIKILENDLKVIKKINPNHISIYCLSIEEKTVFKNWLDRGIINEASSERIIAEYKKICDFAKENSFFHYEVSNFSKKNKESKHNSNYWNHQNGYIGIGPSAHSYDFETRKSNISNNFKYVNAIDQNKIPETIEVLSLKNKTNEYIMTSLRTKKGCDFIFLKKKFEYDIFTEKKIIDLLIQKKYLYIKQNYIVLTELGMLLSDEITSKLFLK